MNFARYLIFNFFYCLSIVYMRVWIVQVCNEHYIYQMQFEFSVHKFQLRGIYIYMYIIIIIIIIIICKQMR